MDFLHPFGRDDDMGQPIPRQDDPASTEDKLTAQRRIEELEKSLCECEQELAAASEIIGEQDCRIEELKVELHGADMMLDEAAEVRRNLERRLAAAEQAQVSHTTTCSPDEMEACQVIEDVIQGRLPAPPPPEDAPNQSAGSDARSRAIVASLAEQWRLRNAK